MRWLSGSLFSMFSAAHSKLQADSLRGSSKKSVDMVSGLVSRLSDSETLSTSVSAGVMIATRVIGTLGTLAYTVLMARMMKPEDFGNVWTLWSAVFIASYLATLNIGATSIREITRARNARNDAVAAGFVVVCRRILLIVAPLMAASFIVLLWWRDPAMIRDHTVAILLAAATIPVMGWNATNSAHALALDQVLRSQVPPMLLRPIIFVAVLSIVWSIGAALTLETVVAIYFLVVVLIALVQFKLVRPYFKFMRSVEPDVSGWRRWITSGLLLAPGRLLTDRLKDLLVLISSVPLGASSVALIAVALSVTNFVNFAVNAIEASFSPKTARSLTNDLTNNIAPNEMRRATHFIAIAGMLKTAVVVFAASVLWLIFPWIMRLFGPDYEVAIPAAWCFMLVPMANAFFGNTSLVMQIFDQRVEFFLTTLVALIALSVMGIFGVPILVARGVDPILATAGSFAIIMVVLQALRWILCLWRTGIDASFLGALIRRQIHIKSCA